MTFEELLQKIDDGEILAPEIDDVIDNEFYEPEKIKEETYKTIIGEGEDYCYGDLLSQKEFDVISHPTDRTQFCITLRTEKQCEIWFLNEEWAFLPVGTRVLIFWQSPRTGEGEHLMIWKRHFFGEFIVGGVADDC